MSCSLCCRTLFLDSVFSAAGSLTILALLLMRAALGESILLCNLSFMVMFLPLLSGQVLNALVAAFRLASIRAAKLNRIHSERTFHMECA